MAVQFETKIDFDNPRWNRDSWARLGGDLNPERQKIGGYSGVVLAVRPGRKVQELFGFEGFAVVRLLPLPEGNYRRLCRETCFYTDLRSGEILEEWKNPWTGEVVKIVPIANDPFNYTISDFLVVAPEHFGSDKSKPPPKIPLRYPWRRLNSTTLALSTDMHLCYPSALQPDKWPRESSGPMAQVSELFRYYASIKDLENPGLTSVNYVGTWNRIGPWLPWMLLGQEPGHIMFLGSMVGSSEHDVVSPRILNYVQKHYPKFMDAPTEDYGPSISSLEIYARTQKPAPPLKQ